MNSRRTSSLVTLAVSAAIIVGCGQTQMVATTGQVRTHMLQGNYQAALGTLRQGKQSAAFREQDRVVYWMDEGMLLHLTRQYQQSNEALSRAEERSKELYTKSISKGGGRATYRGHLKVAPIGQGECRLHAYTRFRVLQHSLQDGCGWRMPVFRDRTKQWRTRWATEPGHWPCVQRPAMVMPQRNH